MMLVLSLLIVTTLVLSFYSVGELTAGVTQALSGAGAFYLLGGLLVLLVGWLVLKKRRAAALARSAHERALTTTNTISP